MTQPVGAAAGSMTRRFGAFVGERFPFALTAALDAFHAAGGDALDDEVAIERARPVLARELDRHLSERPSIDLDETTPGVSVEARRRSAVAELIDACDAFLRRAAIRASISPDERREMLRGMVLTRATDNRLKALFTNGEVRFGDTPFQGKGFRSLGQEAIYGAALRLRRGEQFRKDSEWTGDVIAPIIRDFGYGILPPAAPLATGALTLTGMAMAFARDGSRRLVVTFIGEGGSSLGEWHEAINLCAVRKLPAIFCVQNNQTALSTPVRDQSRVRVFADKAIAYGIPSVTIDGTDPDEIAAAFAWAAERARAGDGTTLIELVCMRMCGHAHHDDMLYLGKDPVLSWGYPTPHDGGYVDRAAWAYWSARDPIATYDERLRAEGVIAAGDLDRLKAEAEAIVEREARAVIDAPWPAPELAGEGVFAGEPRRRRVEVLEPAWRGAIDLGPALPAVDPGPPVDRQGRTFLEGIVLGLRDVLLADDRTFIFGEDVGGAYGNAFLLLRPLLQEFGHRIINSPISESAILGVCVGAALAGQRPIGEMQFNDFVATGFNQVVNNAAKIRYRWGGSVPMVLRMPWGGLRHAGPYHSQNTEPWFYRTPGLKIVVPSTPHDARALMAAAVADPDPVLYYEHIALYRDPRIKQALGDDPPPPIALGRAALRRAGDDLAIVSYGAFVHTALRVAATLAADGIETSVLDLRSLAPLDKAAILAVVRHCSRLLILHEDARTGGIGESIAAIVQEEAFESLDAPIRIVGALDTPVPYSPPLEGFYLPSDAEIERAARLLVAY